MIRSVLLILFINTSGDIGTLSGWEPVDFGDEVTCETRRAYAELYIEKLLERGAFKDIEASIAECLPASAFAENGTNEIEGVVQRLQKKAAQ